MRCPPPSRKSRFRKVNSTGTCCCIVLSAVLASNRMLNSSNPDASFNRGDADAALVRPAWRSVACAFPASNLEPPASRAAEPGLARPERNRKALPGPPTSRLVTTPSSDHDAQELCQLASKLDFRLTPSKQTTSHLLIDNFCTGSAPLPFPTSSLGLQTSSSNRPSPRLEILVSHRKQTVGPISNRPKFALCNFRCLSFSASVPPCHFASSPLLIANDMHSRAESSACKQSTYQILIANAFHYLRSTAEVPRGSSAASSQGLGIQAPLAQQTGLRPAAIRYNEKQATGEPIASPGRTHGISYRAAA